MYQKLDEVINIDYNNRGIHYLYDVNKELYDVPVMEKAVNLINKIEENKFIFLTTGSVTRSWVSTNIGETDGPLGTAVLAKKLREYKNVIPIILTEESLIETTKPVLRAAGFAVVSPEEALSANDNSNKGYTSVVCLLPYTDENESAVSCAESLLNKYKPAAIFSIEKAGRTDNNTYHNMRGHDYSHGRARVDYMFEIAKERGIPTLGIGDGGNEIGMGNIKNVVKEKINYGENLACKVKTDVLITTSVSNWGCYAICAAIALQSGDIKYLHTSEDERRILESAVLSGHVDGATGKAETTVDGLSLQANTAIIELLKAIVMKNIK